MNQTLLMPKYIKQGIYLGRYLPEEMR